MTRNKYLCSSNCPFSVHFTVSVSCKRIVLFSLVFISSLLTEQSPDHVSCLLCVGFWRFLGQFLRSIEASEAGNIFIDFIQSCQLGRAHPCNYNILISVQPSPFPPVHVEGHCMSGNQRKDFVSLEIQTASLMLCLIVCILFLFSFIYFLLVIFFFFNFFFFLKGGGRDRGTFF